MTVQRTETADYVEYADGGATLRVTKTAPPVLTTTIICDDARILARNPEAATWASICETLDTKTSLL